MKLKACSITTRSGTLRQRGFSVVEALLATTIFAMLAMAVIGAIVYGRQSSSDAGDRTRANFLAEEGCEAVRNIRDSAWANLPSTGTHYLGQSSNTWTIGSTVEPAIGTYNRQINVTDVNADTKNIACVVNWTNGGVSRQTNITTRLTNWRAPTTPPITPGPVMMAYSKNTTVPFYRIWNGTSWSAEASTGASGISGNINYVVLKSARARNEAVLGMQTSNGSIYVQAWNGTSWSAAVQVGTATTAATRGFDIAYEKNSDRLLITYSPAFLSADFAYRTWDGTTLSPATTITTPPTIGYTNWIETEQNPVSTSNEITMIMLDSNSDVYGMRWNGTTWDTMGNAAAWDTTASNASRKGIDVEYEETTGRAMFMWGDATSTDNYYRIWNGTTLTAATLLDIPTMGGVANWVQLAGRPGSSEIMFGVQDAGGDLNTRKWSGTAWDTATQHPEHDDATENIASRNFDIGWETYAANLGRAWLIWGDGSTRSEKMWSGTSWGAANIASGSDDTSFVRLRADMASGAMFSGIYQCSCSAASNRDINERHLVDGASTWSDSNQLWGGPTTADPVYFRIDIATP